MRAFRMTKTLTSGNPAKLIFLFTIPLLIGNLFQQFYNMADTLIVGRTLGVEALAAVGCTGGLMFFILGFVIGFTAGLAIITAQRFGAGRRRAVRRSFAVCIVLSSVMTVLLTAVSVAFARPVLELLQTPPEILEAAHAYIIVISWGIGAAMLFNLLSNVLRALGDSRTPLYFLVLACVLNIALDLALILRFGMGPAGAAVATVASQLVAGLQHLRVDLHGFEDLSVGLPDHPHPQVGEPKLVMRLGVLGVDFYHVPVFENGFLELVFREILLTLLPVPLHLLFLGAPGNRHGQGEKKHEAYGQQPFLSSSIHCESPFTE